MASHPRTSSKRILIMWIILLADLHTGKALYDIPNLRQQKMTPMMVTGELPDGLHGSLFMDATKNDLFGIENKLAGMDAKLNNHSLQLLERQTEEKLRIRIRQTSHLADIQEDADAVHSTISQGAPKDTLNIAVLQNLLKHGTAVNEYHFVHVHKSIEKLRESINLETTKSKSKILNGYTSISSAINATRVGPLVSKLLTITKIFSQKTNHLLQLPEINKKNEIKRQGGYIDYIESCGLDKTLYDIIHQKLAIPNSTSDSSAALILDLLFDGLQIYVSMMLSLVLTNIYLAHNALRERNLNNFNQFMSQVNSSILRLKLNLDFDDEHSLGNEINIVLHTIRSLSYTPQIPRLAELLAEKQEILEQINMNVNQYARDNMPLSAPRRLTGRLDFTDSSIPLPFGPWKYGVQVRYAIQFISDNRISPVGEWSQPYTITDKGNPIVYLPSGMDGVRCHVYRRFNEEKPELVAIMKNENQTSFRDIGRDLINAITDLNKVLAASKVQLLLNDGANVNVTLENNMAPLHQAAKSNNVEVLEILINETADIHAKSSDGLTCLHFAALLGSEDALHYLIDKGAFLNIQTRSFGWSPLHTAVSQDQIQAAQILIENNALINIKDKMGLTPLHFSVMGKGQATELLLKAENIDVNARDNHGQTPLHHAARTCNISYSKQLLVHPEIDVDALSEDRLSPLHCAAIGGNVELIAELIKHNASLSLADGTGSTALHYAAFYGNAEATLLLELFNQSLLSVENTEGNTPLDLAHENGNADTIEVLQIEADEVSHNETQLNKILTYTGYSLETINCTQQTVQEMAVLSEDTCDQISRITAYVEVILSKLPMTSKYEEHEDISNIIRYYNNGLRNAKRNSRSWRSQDNIFISIQQTFSLAKNFETQFNKWYKIKQERVLNISRNTNEEKITEYNKREIAYLQNEIQEAKSAYVQAASEVAKIFLETQIGKLEARLKVKQQSLSSDPTLTSQLEEELFFLELVRSDATKVSNKAVAMKQKMKIFQSNINADVEIFNRIGIRAKNTLSNLQHQSIKNNAELKGILEMQGKLEAEIEMHITRINELHDEIYRFQKELRDQRRRLLAQSKKNSVMKYIWKILSTLNIIPKSLMHIANDEEQRHIKEWESNLAESREEANRVARIIKEKQKIITNLRETIANGSRNSETLNSELCVFNYLDNDLQMIIRELPSMQPSVASIIAGLQKIEDIFTHINEQISEMIDVGKTTSTTAEITNTLHSIHERLSTLQCYWKGSTLYISNMKSCY